MNKKFLFLLVFSFFLTSIIVSAGSFQVNNILLKVSIHSGESVNKSLSISSEDGGEFKFEVVGVPSVKISEQSVVLNIGEQRAVSVMFDARSLSPGIYSGSIKVTSNTEISYIPVIFEVESNDVLFDLNLDIPPQYSTIGPGDKLLAQIKIYDLSSGGTSEGLGSSKVDVEYLVQGIDGRVLSTESETLLVNKQTQVTKSLSFPKDVASGDYIFSAKVIYHSSVGVASSLFTVSKKPLNLFSFVDFTNNMVVVIIFSGILFFFLILLLIFVYFIKDRDKLILELKKYNNSELKNQQRILLAQQKVLVSKYGCKPSKIKEEVDEKIVELKQKQKKREEELRNLRESGNVDAMKKKLSEWRQRGYNVFGLDYKLKNLTVGEMQKIMHEWKKKYSTEDYKNKK